MTTLAALSHSDLATILAVLAVLCFLAAVYLVFTGRALEALFAAVIGLIILIAA